MAQRRAVAVVVAAVVAASCTGKAPGTGTETTTPPGDGSAGVAGSSVDGGSDGGSDAADAGTAAGGTADAGTAADGGSDAGTAAGGTADAGTTATDGGTADAGTALAPPITSGAWTFYGPSQGISTDVSDVSADEGGNVYVAGGDALYAKRRGDSSFLRFDADNAGLTRNCYAAPPENDPGFLAAIDGKAHPTPPGPAIQCPVISVAGGASGVAAVGLKGLGTDNEPDADWAQASGGLDMVRFDGTTLTRTRHAFLASPPHTVCAAGGKETRATWCSDEWEYFWVVGRRKLRQVNRIVVNHQQGSPLYGDVWAGGTHATFAALLANAGQRGFLDRTAGQPASWADAKDVWEHDHPAIYDTFTDQFLTGATYALAIEPGSGRPWGSNGFRTAWVANYGADLSNDVWWLEPIDAAHPNWIDLWTDSGDPQGGTNDHVESLSFCDDGTLWIGSSTHGLARRDPGGGIQGIDLPDPGAHGDNVYAVACDPSDRSVWIGLGWGGVMRYKDGRFTTLDPNQPGLPGFVQQPVRSIQIDRWASPRVVWFAFMPSKDPSGRIQRPGGVASYSGP